MKKKSVTDIKFGEKVMSVLTEPLGFHDITSRTSLDKSTAQKTLATLAKHGYICKDSKDFWVILV